MIRVLHLDVEERSEELLRQLSYASIRAPIIGPFCAWKPPIPYAIKNQQANFAFQSP